MTRPFPHHLPTLCRWTVMGIVLAIWLLAFTRALIDPTPRLPILFNVTPSLPYSIAIVDKHPGNWKRGDFVVFAFAGEARKHYAGLARQPFFKVIRGLPGDAITVTNRHVFINGAPVGTAKPSGFDGYRLAPIESMVIPEGHYYVQGSSPDSFDSRYRESGLVRADQILFKVKPIF